MLFTAVSPVMVFYSRYYIPEMLLLAFNFSALVSFYFYFRKPGIFWAMSGGIFLGLMVATKETAVISYFAMLLSLVVSGYWQFRGGVIRKIREINLLHLWVMVLTASLVAAVLLSSFLTNWQGVTEFIGSYSTYISRAGQNAWHLHPWYFYFQLLFFYHEGAGPFWTEAAIFLLALIGVGMVLFSSRFNSPQFRHNSDDSYGFTGRFLCRYLVVYTLFIMLVYSAIHYKTPWCLINFWQGIILLAGVGMRWLFESFSSKPFRFLLVFLLGVSVGHLVWLSQLGNSRYCADPRNPYVYAHTSVDVFEMVRQIDRLAAIPPEHYNLTVQIYSRQNLWPLPWYLRRFARQQWWREVRDEAPLAQVLLATPEMEADLVRKIYELPPPGQREMYMWLFKEPLQLRPQVEVRGYVAKSLWDKLE
jgi:uncharacterized protein (TIGR03663 family)